ncbi:Os05g0138000, partial [Oryza sativa Japonica Group]
LLTIDRDGFLGSHHHVAIQEGTHHPQPAGDQHQRQHRRASSSPPRQEAAPPLLLLLRRRHAVVVVVVVDDDGDAHRRRRGGGGGDEEVVAAVRRRDGVRLRGRPGHVVYARQQVQALRRRRRRHLLTPAGRPPLTGDPSIHPLHGDRDGDRVHTAIAPSLQICREMQQH